MGRRPASLLLLALVVAGAASFVLMTRVRATERFESDPEAATPAPVERSAPDLLRAPGDGRINAAGSQPSRDDPLPSNVDLHDAGPEPVPGDATLDGIVVDESGRPLEGVLVHAWSLLGDAPAVCGWEVKGARSYMTGKDGRFAIVGLAAGGTLLFADGPGSAEDMSGTVEDVQLKAPARAVRLVLVRLGWARLRVLEPDGTPFVGTARWVSSGSLERRQMSGAQVETKDGTFGRYGLVDGDYIFQVQVDGFAPIGKPFHARQGSLVDLGDVTLDPGVTLRGRLQDAAGEPVAGARGVRDVQVIVNSIPIATSNSQGAFTLEHVPRGPVDLTVMADGYLWQTVHLSEAQVESGVVVRLLRGGVVHGILRDVGAQPAGSVALRALPLDATGEPTKEESSSLKTQESGYMYWHLPAGRWRIVWQRPASRGEATEDVPLADWTLTEGEKTKVDLTLPAR